MHSKDLIVMGDRVLIKIDDQERRTEVGLYLPPSVKDKEDVQGGHIIKVGPGTPLVEPSLLMRGAWGEEDEVNVRYIPMQAKKGDYALFLRKAAIELQFENEEYLIVPQSALLVLIREKEEELRPDLIS